MSHECILSHTCTPCLHSCVCVKQKYIEIDGHGQTGRTLLPHVFMLFFKLISKMKNPGEATQS